MTNKIVSNACPVFGALIGNWKNIAIPAENNELLTGSEANPLSYNIMPLPQKGGNNVGFILKNFTYYETLKINNENDVAAPATAPNREGTYQQDVQAWFYSQQVRFAEGPDTNKVIHEENGAWLDLTTRGPQKIGPYEKGENLSSSSDVPKQPEDIGIAKQMAVPHGNSILSLGQIYDVQKGAPEIHNANAYPTNIKNGETPADFKAIYNENLSSLNDYQNPNTDYTLNPNKPIQDAASLIKPTHYRKWHVTTKKLEDGQGAIVNIPFTKISTDVVQYEATYWLLSNDGGINYDYLLYTQNISMIININEGENKGEYNFPHITCNALTRENSKSISAKL
ncbi:hypothetical protein CJF42_00350 [Pseudoalteromonas sp. NBT06-2]|uniref:heme-binding protein n=1 Tax=Pseudoalteromonas sp. NBT06-2 TaxID=2025950 RepID=UPI000BA5D169|nr:heme-binding protein [Pseudoalteromonas sp. NBT06-2]PAJ76385.1 hypothetical protein CJF42_00350 [Pseudoalteromonas sp. NBT06-2]